MKYVSTNEIDKFGYADCQINSVKLADDTLNLILDALIVKKDNSQNSNYTESYAAESIMELKNFKIEGIIKEGYKYYDANDRLIEEHPDEPVDVESFNLKAVFEGAYLPSLEERDGKYAMEVELAGEDISEVTDTYEVTFTCDEIKVSWDQYMNRVGN